MTNQEYIDELTEREYQKYLKGLNIPSKEQWLKMTYKLTPKFKVGDFIKNIQLPELATEYHIIDMDDHSYTVCAESDENSELIVHCAIEAVDSNFILKC